MTRVAVANRVPKQIPISVEMYHYMGEIGAIGPDERVELIDGEIFEMSPVGSLHVRCVNFLTDLLVRMLGEKFLVSIQNPIISANDTEPQPDLTVLHRPTDLYRDHLPTGSDTVIVIEVADTSASFDRNRKFPKYAQAGIPEAWLVDLKRDVVEMHSDPAENGYSLVKTYRRGDTLVSAAIPGIEITVDDILG